MKTNSSAVIIPAPAPATNNAVTNSLAAEDIRAIKPPVEIPSGWFWLWLVLGSLGVAALSALAWRYWQKHRARPQELAVIVLPHERARRKLLEALKLIYEPQPFCIAVSGTLRTYLEEAFSLRAPERTTEEFLNELQSSALLSLSQKQSLADFLMRCDLVKFARDEPTVDRLKELHESALRLVDETSYFRQDGGAISSPAGSSREPAPEESTPLRASIESGVGERTASIVNHKS